MSPAIVDPSGRAVWPDPKAIQGVSSELVNDTSIALFFGDPSEVPTSSYSKVFRVQAVGTRPPANAPHSSFNDWAVVSPADAERIRGVGLSCQMIFLTAR
ncbi:hypothetical protein MGR01S_05730 [Meiothermus granaticius NBRC 107808]|nr:hypothetical protein MGR01S_05730 [Meiothermus granaticius NBRC 107808]